ncbi:MAG: anhydro-N-acetylmuramic acid kinase [Propionibacteriaceae bacterium]
MRLLGLISGTSHDGVDAAVVDFDLDGSTLTARIVHHDSTPYPTDLRARVVAALPPRPTSTDELCRLDTLIGQHFATAAAAAVAVAGPVDAIATHGQTVFHWVEGDRALGTLQLGQPAWLAERLGVPVVSDLRSRDVAAGGQGAPLVPLLDNLLLPPEVRPAAALNLGGIANVTLLDSETPLAYDIGPANALIDAVVQDRDLHPEGYDEGGRIAAAGTVHPRLLEHLLADPYYTLPAPKSTGKELFHSQYVAEALTWLDEEISAADLVATLTRLTADGVARDLRAAGVTRVVAAGGGVANPVLMGWLADGLPGVVLETTDAIGMPADAKEAFAFALLGWCTLHGVPANVPSATGASGPRVLGSITPGAGPLRLPEPAATPTALRLVASS